MKLNFLTFGLINLIHLISIDADDAGMSKSTAAQRGFRAGRRSLIAFEPFGKEVHVGLDLLLPFVKVPTQRKLDQYGKENALLTVNTAAVTVAGMISGFGIFLGHILKSIFTLRGRESKEESATKESGESHAAADRLDFDMQGHRFSRLLEAPFKFAYRNSSGGRVDTDLASLLRSIENLLLDNNVDLSACIQKSICTLIKRSSLNVVNGDASALECIVDGISQLDWISYLMRETAIEEAIQAGKSNMQDQCVVKYPTCHWNEPDQRLLYLINKRVKFV